MDFALVGALLTVLFVAVVQLTLALHVRNTLIDCAAEGARYGAVSGRGTDDAVVRTRRLAGQSLSDAYTQDVTAERTVRGGLDVIEVRVAAPLPVVGLIGPAGRLVVSAHALVEEP